MDPLDRLNEKPCHARDPDRKDALETQVRKAGGLLLQPQSMHRPFDVAQRCASRSNARYRRVRRAAGKIEKNVTHSMLAVHSVCSGCGALLSLSETLDAVGDLGSFVAFVRKLCDREGEGLEIPGDA